tara:strand:- start:2573 stop:2779 length:207 start_codon:yes stop_codon:yes gene_type:complete
MAFLYFALFAILAGSAFALMYANIQAISQMSRPIKRNRHPEAPEYGEEVMYVDFSREKLEELYNKDID